MGNPARDTVQFHTVQAAVCHALGQHPEEVANAHGRFQNVSCAEAHAFHRIIDGTDDSGAGIVSIQNGTAGGFVFLLGEQPFQFGVLLCPTALVWVKGIRQTAPANILRKHLLFFGSGTPVLLFQLEQGTDGFDVPGEFLFGASDTQIIIRDVEVPGKFKCGSFRFNGIQSR